MFGGRKGSRTKTTHRRVHNHGKKPRLGSDPLEWIRDIQMEI
jgi:hypothetical protein